MRHRAIGDICITIPSVESRLFAIATDFFRLNKQINLTFATVRICEREYRNQMTTFPSVKRQSNCTKL